MPPATLRAWERRYGIVEPARTDAGYRLYGEADERRLRRMLELITEGAAPAEAAARARREAQAASESTPDPSPVRRSADGAGLAAELSEALLSFDEAEAHRAIDRAIAAYSLEALLDELVLPVLRGIGERWNRGDVSVDQEHFASNVIRGRLTALTRDWGGGSGPRALLACPPGEEHDLGLIAFGLALRGRGWRIALLGADTPLEALRQATERLDPALVVLALLTPAAAERLLAEPPPALAAPLAVAGAAADERLAAALGARLLPADVQLAAAELDATV